MPVCSVCTQQRFGLPLALTGQPRLFAIVAPLRFTFSRAAPGPARRAQRLRQRPARQRARRPQPQPPQAHPAQRSCLCTSTYIRIIVFRSRALQQLASNANQPRTCNHVSTSTRSQANLSIQQPDASRSTPTCDAHRNLQPTSTILHYPYLIKPKTQRTGGATRNGATQPTRQRATANALKALNLNAQGCNLKRQGTPQGSKN